ncbi:hypothetical protein CBFG_04838 [Clostridiales bacterium 1_7_47FAA]|nr:hypothetical protein CBFG_04838 [Clostridiales bacterium 1_7_47FAA]
MLPSAFPQIKPIQQAMLPFSYGSIFYYPHDSGIIWVSYR